MIAELGHAALWLAAALALLQFAGPTWGLATNRGDLIALARPAAVAQALLCALAFGALTYAFVESDFSVALVTTNSHTMKPMLYKITGVWANHEGSLLLWVLVMAVAGAGVALAPATLGERFRARVLSVQALIAAGFFAFLLLASNPFERMFPAPTEGQGMNPLLQDPGLAFHPPLLYVGYVGLSVAFAFAVAGMLEQRIGQDFARAMRPWVLAAWAFLTAGITLGSWWAYYELGWGGFWFWDPVENASLMPWLAATALLHSVAVLAKRDALRTWTLLLAVVAFSLSMLGTFIVRSGLLTSVHAFAVDPERGLFLLGLLAAYIGGALLVFALRAGSVPVGQGFNVVSREGALVANNLVLSAILGVVFVGTLYPMLLEGVTGEQISVGPPYFDATTAPLFLPLVALMAVGPFLAWKTARADRALRPMLPAVVAMAALTVVALLLWDVRGLLALLGFGAAALLAVASVMILVRRNPLRTPAWTWGMAVAHLGVALSLFGITASESMVKETLASVRVGQMVSVGGFEARLDDVTPVGGPNWSAIEARVTVTRGGEPMFVLRPQQRTFTNPQMETTEAGIASTWDGQVYAVLNKPDGFGNWQLHIWFKPFVWWIWIGGGLMALGGLLSIGSRFRLRGTATSARPVPLPAGPAAVPAE